jgi:hypothetical protein
MRRRCRSSVAFSAGPMAPRGGVVAVVLHVTVDLFCPGLGLRAVGSLDYLLSGVCPAAVLGCVEPVRFTDRQHESENGRSGCW